MASGSHSIPYHWVRVMCPSTLFCQYIPLWDILTCFTLIMFFEDARAEIKSTRRIVFSAEGVRDLQQLVKVYSR